MKELEHKEASVLEKYRKQSERSIVKAAKDISTHTTYSCRTETKTPKSARTRQRILANASMLIKQRGSADFQMSELAELCEMSKGALYYYFADRDAVVESILSMRLDEFVETLETTIESADTPQDSLRAMCHRFAETLNNEEAIIAIMATELVRGGPDVIRRVEARFERLNRLIAQQIELAKQQGIVRDDVDARLLSACISGTFFFTTFASRVTPDKPVDGRKLADELLKFIAYGIVKR